MQAFIFDVDGTLVDSVAMHERDAIVVGDTPYDAQAAAEVGIRTIGLRSGGFPEADLRRAGCIAVYEDPADLLARYDRMMADARA